MDKITTNGFLIVDRIDKLLTHRNETRKDLAKSLNISPSSISNWSKRGTIPAADIACNIAEYLNVSLEWLLTGKESEGFECSKEEKELLSSLRLLDERDRQEILDLIEIKLNRTISRQAQDKTAVPSA